MYRTRFEYSGKSFSIYPYDTNQEKALLLMGGVGTIDLGDALSICGMEDDIIETLSNEEKITLLYKHREISVGDELNLKFKCKHCGAGNENVLLISDIVQDSNIKDDRITDQFKEVTEDNLEEFVNIEIDDLDINDYEKLLKDVKESVTKFEFKKPIICQKCNGQNHVRIDAPEFVIDNMSEDSLASLYQSYNDLTFFGSYTKRDVDSLYPFERMILINLLNKSREDLNK